MIKAKTLRLGNLVNDIELNVLTVASIQQNAITIEENKTIYGPADLKGIPISYYMMSGEGGFIDYVFPSFEDYRHLQNGQIILRFPKELTEEGTCHVFKLNSSPVKSEPVFIKTIGTVHELQNIVFFIVGKELPLNKKHFQNPLNPNDE